MKSHILAITNFLKIPQLALRFIRSPRVLLYHGVTDRDNFLGIENYRRKHIPQEEFRYQVQFLKLHFQIVPLEELVATLARSPAKARGMIAITFDDGYQNIFRVAWPILQDYGLPFTIFLPTDFIEGQDPFWVDRLEYAINKSKSDGLSIIKNGKKIVFPIRTTQEKVYTDTAIREYAKSIPDRERQKLIDEVVSQYGVDLRDHFLEEPDYVPFKWEEIQEMLKSGLLTIGSHTATHAIATRLPLEEFRQQLIDSRRLIEERLNVRCSLFAYPNGQPGDFSDQTARVLAETDFRAAFTTEMKFLGKKENIFGLPRLAMDGTEDRGMFLATVSGLRMFLRKMRNFLWIKKPQSEVISYFDRQAAEYELFYVASTPKGYSFRIRRKRILELLSNLPAGTKILDIGCGPGVYTKELLDRGFEVWGIDPAPKMIKIAQDRFGQNSHTHFMVAQIESLPFANNLFDVVIAAGVFEYLNNLEIGFQEVYRVLSPGGIFIATFPYFWSLSRIWDRLIIRTISKVLRFVWRREAKMESREFSGKEINEMLEKKDFKIKTVTFYNARFIWTPFDRLFPRFATLLSQRLDETMPFFLKTGFIIYGQK